MAISGQKAGSGDSTVPTEVRRALVEALREDARQRAFAEDPVYRSLWEVPSFEA